MNCKAGDLAVAVGPHADNPNMGMLVEVLYREPTGIYRKPDGVLAEGHADSWVIKSLGRPFSLFTTDGWPTKAVYAGCRDSYLRPIIPPDSVTDEPAREPSVRNEHWEKLFSIEPSEVIEHVFGARQ